MTTEAEAISLPFDEAIAFFRQKANVKTERWNDVWREGHSRSFMVAGAATDELVQDFRVAIDKAISEGTTLQEFRKDFAGIVQKHGWEYNGGPGWRTRVIYETNLSSAYSAGRYAQMSDPEVTAAFPYWQYVHGDSQRPRPMHLSWNGTTLRCDDDWWNTHYTPNGWRCSCWIRPVSEAGLRRMGKEGPDQAPPVTYRTWINKQGVPHQVPVGIDPGFDYNPGKAWLHAPAQNPGWKPAPGSPPGVAPIAKHDLASADKALKALQQPWADALTEPQAQALADYKGTYGRTMNLQGRGLRSSPDLAAMVEQLHAALATAEAPADLVVHRGISEAEAELYLGLKPGDAHKLDAFFSTTLDQGFAKDVAQIEGGRVVQLLVRKGQKGVAYVHPFPKYRFKQYELLVNVGKVLRVLQADHDNILLEIDDDDAE